MLSLGKKKKAQKFDRSAAIDAGDRARTRGKLKRAITEYRKVLAVDPEDAAVHGRLAPLLVRTGQLQEAVKSFAVAAAAFRKQGFGEKALALDLQAARALPHRSELWVAVAEAHQKANRNADAIKALLEGRSHQSHRSERAVAAELLERALAINPNHLDAGLDLARVRAKLGDAAAARELLARLASHVRGPGLRRIRRTEFQIWPGPGSLWRWMRGR